MIIQLSTISWTKVQLQTALIKRLKQDQTIDSLIVETLLHIDKKETLTLIEQLIPNRALPLDSLHLSSFLYRNTKNKKAIEVALKKIEMLDVKGLSEGLWYFSYFDFDSRIIELLEKYATHNNKDVAFAANRVRRTLYTKKGNWFTNKLKSIFVR